MPIKPRDNLPPPPTDMQNDRDGERIINGGAIYSLHEVKEHVIQLKINAFEFATESASNDLITDLRWNLQDLCGFVCALEPCFYKRSVWCLPSSGIGVTPFPTDVYIMGYNKMLKKENPKQNPWNYFKFSFSLTGNTIEIFSIHTEDKNKNKRYSTKK